MPKHKVYIVPRVKTELEVGSTGIHHPLMPCTLPLLLQDDEGMVGMCPVFTNKRKAMKATGCKAEDLLEGWVVE